MPLPSSHELVQAIANWMGPARWHLGEATDFTPDGYTTLYSGKEGAIIWLAVRDGETNYNVPLVLIPRSNAEGPGADSDAPTPVGNTAEYKIFDAAENQLGQRTLLGLLNATITPKSPETFTLTGAPLHPVHAGIRSAHKLTSEQSNTSVIYELDDSTKLILKIFRVLVPGHNPDVELQQALDGTGSVPAQRGSVSLAWDQPSLKVCEAPGRRRADVVVVQEFLDGAKDAWQVMQAHLSETDGTLGTTEESIRALGDLTRRIHMELATAFPPIPASQFRRAAIESSWRARGRHALNLVPSLRAHEAAIDEAFSAAAALPWPDLQRIHGDYHLGQVLEVPGRGWFALDFEGEPLRPMEERTGVDLALRDVAGMLRSFDYAAGAAELAGSDARAVHAWAQAAEEAFLAGYGELDADQGMLLRALMIDKALYEVAYEAAERPSWLRVPVSGVERILSHVS